MKKFGKKFTRFYDDNYVGEKLLKQVKEKVKNDTPLMWDYNEVYNSDYTNESHKRAAEEYRRLKIEFITDKYELEEKLKANNPAFWKTHNLDKYWEQYLERDKLIASGLYEKARQDVYINSYMETAAQFMGDNKILDIVTYNLSKLTPEQFTALTKPSGDRDKVTSALPPIQEIYLIASVMSDNSQYESFIDRFKTAYTEAGLEWLDMPNKNKKEEKTEETSVTKTVEYSNKNYKIYINKLINEGTTDRYGRTYRQQLIFANKQERENILINKPDVSDTFKARKETLAILKRREESLLSRGKALVYISRAGKYYIPGVSKEVTEDYLKTYHSNYNGK